MSKISSIYHSHQHIWKAGSRQFKRKKTIEKKMRHASSRNRRKKLPNALTSAADCAKMNGL